MQRGQGPEKNGPFAVSLGSRTQRSVKGVMTSRPFKPLRFAQNAVNFGMCHCKLGKDLWGNWGNQAKMQKPWQNNVGRRLDGLVLVAVLELPGTLSDGHLIYKFNSTFPEPPYHSISLVYNYHLQRILKIWEPNVIHLPIPVEAKPSMEYQWDTRLALFKEPLHLPSFKLCCNKNKRMSQQLLGPSCWDSQANSSLFKMPGQNFLQLGRTTHIAISSMRSSMIHAFVQAETNQHWLECAQDCFQPVRSEEHYLQISFTI